MPFSITENCKGCGTCIKTCPTLAISGNKKSIHVIDPGRCIGCGVCGRICPTEGSVMDTEGKPALRLKRSEWPKPVVIRSTCSSCSICVDICPFDCLELSEPEDFPKTIKTHACLKDEKACVACGICVEACPQEAIYLARTL